MTIDFEIENKTAEMKLRTESAFGNVTIKEDFHLDERSGGFKELLNMSVEILKVLLDCDNQNIVFATKQVLKNEFGLTECEE